MKKNGNFLRSLIPFLFIIAIQVAVTVVLFLIRALASMSGSGFSMESLLNSVGSISTPEFSQNVNLIYGAVGLILFGSWYFLVFVKPFQKRERNYPSGFSFHTVMALICLAVGMQYVCTLVVDLTGFINAGWVSRYNELMESAGYGSITPLLLLYTVLLAPFVEELAFRGLVFRYARHALPFWAANLWQALLFGIVHMNIIQGVYAFTMGLFLGWICHRGRGIKYSILLHIIFNLFGSLYSGLFSFTTALSYPAFIGLGIALTLFGIWLFYTDFLTEPEPHRMRMGNTER